jgi:hypothetical protein
MKKLEAYKLGMAKRRELINARLEQNLPKKSKAKPKSKLNKTE